MATTTACPLKATAVMCLLWMVFLSTSAVGNSEKPNLDEEEAAFEMTGAYANGRRLLSICHNLEPKLKRRVHLVEEKNLKDIRIFVTKEKLAWIFVMSTAEYKAYLRFFIKCVVLFEMHIEYVTYELEQAFETLLQKFANGAHLEEPDMATIRRIIVNEKNLWS
ncbi:hypothetical protein SeMB42_g03623 [Synchytrium endobioticum]|uniref:Uncharacterized protein n=1 Tax=Synchytrium endobioticum TaxID=286115 RepID=A0A507D513_9FUNG|nr:hypothetical protein SeMB42_g03623 [Synchytrium endobioticum]